MLETEFKNNTLTAFLSGEIDHDSAVEIRARVDGLAQALRPRLLCLDFGKVSFMDSSGVGLVMGRYKAARSLGCRVTVRGLRPRDQKIMRLSGLSALVTFQ